MVDAPSPPKGGPSQRGKAPDDQPPRYCDTAPQPLAQRSARPSSARPIRLVFQFPASITSVVDAPRLVRLRRPSRPEWAVTRGSTPAAGPHPRTAAPPSAARAAARPAPRRRARGGPQRPEAAGDAVLHEPQGPLPRPPRLTAADRNDGRTRQQRRVLQRQPVSVGAGKTPSRD